jgi:hypothetical protein
MFKKIFLYVDRYVICDVLCLKVDNVRLDLGCDLSPHEEQLVYSYCD